MKLKNARHQIVAEYLIIMAGVFILAAAITLFLEPNNLVTGGASGLGIIIRGAMEQVPALRNYQPPLWLTNTLINAPLLFLGAKARGRVFITRTLFATLFFSVSLYISTYIPPVNLEDMFLSSIFGGVICGVGIGLAFRNNATTGGSDLAASIINRYHKRFSVAKSMFVIDAAIIALGLFVFGVENALYSIISVFVSSKAVNMVLEGLSYSSAAFIISEESDRVADVLMNNLNRGVTALYGRGHYTRADKNILLCVVGVKQLPLLKKLVNTVDPKAFVIVTDVREVLGEGFEDSI